jgi:hypothetical protein
VNDSAKVNDGSRGHGAHRHRLSHIGPVDRLRTPGEHRRRISRYDIRVLEIHRSARKHGIDVDDIRHAHSHFVAVEEVGEDPVRLLYLGPDRATRLLEIVTIVRPARAELAIHAMLMRAQYRRLLKGTRP